MNKLITLLALAAVTLPACQTGFQQEKLADADRQIEAYRNQNNQLRSDRDIALAESQQLQEELQFSRSRGSELENRVSAMEASAQQADAEVEKLRGQLAGTGVGVERRGDVLVLDLPSSLTFPSGSATLNDKGRSSLKAVAAAIKGEYAAKTFWIEGHTDNDPLNKTKDKWKTNLRLSSERAMAVADYLVGEMGIKQSSVRTAAHGEWDPKVPNSNVKNKELNRRVEILILD